MTTKEFNITIHMVCSLDGMIAKKDNSVEWFETSSNYEKGVVGQDPEEFNKSIDCYVMGANTYELALALSKNYGWPYGDKPTMVLTNRNMQTVHPNIKFYSGDLHKLVNEQLKPFYKNVWVVGGAHITRSFLQSKLVDEIRVSILPIILGDGLLFFEHIGAEQPLKLKDTIAYKNGMVELCYEINK